MQGNYSDHFPLFVNSTQAINYHDPFVVVFEEKLAIWLLLTSVNSPNLLKISLNVLLLLIVAIGVIVGSLVPLTCRVTLRVQSHQLIFYDCFLVVAIIR